MASFLAMFADFSSLDKALSLFIKACTERRRMWRYYEEDTVREVGEERVRERLGGSSCRTAKAIYR